MEYPQLTNRLIDNSSEHLSMVYVLKACFNNENVTMARIATGYWDIPGLALIADDIRRFLERDGARLQLLLGKDPYVYAYQLEKPKYKDAEFPQDFIKTDLNDLEVTDEYKDAVNLLLDYCQPEDDPKIEIRLYKTNESNEMQFLHSKCYIFNSPSNSVSCGIIGSSNFTAMGLQGNAELNSLEIDPHIVMSPMQIPNNKSHYLWFNEKWELSEPWTKEFYEQILKKAPITIAIDGEKEKKKKEEAEAPFTPYEQYIKLLQIKFGDVVDVSLGQQIESYLPKNFQKLDYQIDAVKRCLSIMHEHGGFMLADVVGLGKTIIGMLIIKRFLSVPEDDGRERRVLIITPPAIQSAWKKTLKMFDDEDDNKIEPLIDFITTGRISNIDGDEDYDYDDDDSNDTGEFNEALEYKNYGLIIIDESHKFRNSTTYMYQALDNLIQRIFQDTSVYPYVGLLSATPQNNRPNDLKNQIYLFERNHIKSTLKKAEGGNIEKFFADISREYELVIAKRKRLRPQDVKEEEESRNRLVELSQKLRDCVLCDILERRTRTDIKNYYPGDIDSQHLAFPIVKGPNNILYFMDAELAKLFSDTMNIIAPDDNESPLEDAYLHYYRYRAIEYFVDEANSRKHVGRGNRGPADVSRQLANIMQNLLVKRLESSFTAFHKSLLNLRRYTQNMIDMWENNTIFVCPQIDVNKELDRDDKKKRKRKTRYTFADCVNDIRNKIKQLDEQGRNEQKQNAEYTRDDFKQEYIKLLKQDHKLISDLCDRWGNNSQDPKFDAFKENLKSTFFNNETNVSGKLVIFSEAIDTVDSLKRAVEQKGYRALVVKAANRDKLEPVIEENFDASYEGEWKNEYDVIITTEVLAEGINLHRANVVVNYDTPWNSTRLMQRIGRVNRIGSLKPFKNVYVYNFMPSAQGNDIIDLVHRAHTKLQSFHILFGEDNKIFTPAEEVYHYDIAKAIDGEESPMQKYVAELKQYKEAHPQRYELIEQNNTDWEIAQALQGEAYFIVKAPRSARLEVRIKDGESQIISALDMLTAMRVDENTPSVPLPENWPELRKKAMDTYDSYFVDISRSRAGDMRTKAIGVIADLNRKENITPESKELLKKARKLADRGSIDIIKILIKIGDELSDTTRIFKTTEADINQMLNQKISKLVEQVTEKQGKGEIILGTIK